MVVNRDAEYPQERVGAILLKEQLTVAILGTV